MVLKSKIKVQPLTEKQEKQYVARKTLSHKIGCLERQLSELKEDRNKLDTRLAPIFEQFGNRRRLSDGTIVERRVIDVEEKIVTKAMVGTILRSGFSYPRYSEVARD
jgi:hypothetical protein